MFPSKMAAEDIKKVDKEIFEKVFSKDVADYIANTCYEAVLKGNGFKIPIYFQNVGTALGDIMAKKGYLNCENVKDTATKFFESEQRAFDALKSDKLDAYEKALCTAMQETLGKHNKAAIWKQIVDKFNGLS